MEEERQDGELPLTIQFVLELVVLLKFMEIMQRMLDYGWQVWGFKASINYVL